MAVLKGLKPEKVFAYFEKLCLVPHGSGNTKIISDLCVGFAKELGLKYRQEPCNNVVIWKPASPGHESAEPIILQGHIDMVCAKTDDCTKDMTREGLDLMTDGEWIWADKTSLGGDNCIAVAMILAILSDDTLVHPPIEAVFTVDEEVGMDGAFALDCSDLKGRKLLNLDSEIEGVFTVSCAGGMRADCHLPGIMEPVAGMAGYSITLAGLQGGHSGGDIHLGRASANQVMGRVLYSAMEGFGITVAGLRGGHSGADIHLGRGSGNRLMGRVLATALEKFPGLRLAAISGGQFDNVICSRCDAAVALPKGSGRAFEAFIRELEGVLKNEYAVTDPDVTLTCAAAETAKAVSAERTVTLVQALTAMPQGVEAMDTDFPGLVQTSLNMGVVKLGGDGLHIAFSIRSSIASRKLMLAQRVRAVAALAGGTVAERGVYPGWQYKRESQFRDTLLAAYKDLTGKDGVVEATHGGLECGLLMEKIPGLDAVSMGPELHDVHSVRERLSVPSTERTYELVCELLRRSC